MSTKIYHKQAGLSLLEVLISLIVFSIGMLGTASLMGSAVRNNHGAYLRSQAGYMVQNMADRMRSNIQGVQAGAYNSVSLGGANAGTAPACAVAATCDAAQRATLDIVTWQNAVAATLPAGQSSVTVDGNEFVIHVEWLEANGEMQDFDMRIMP